MFAIGHFALGYLTSKTSSAFLKTKLNLPLLFLVSVIPDIDLILQFVEPTLFMHRGPTHSIIVQTVIIIPFFVIYRKKALPYYLALLSHSLLGDFFTGGFEMFWPLSSNWFGDLSFGVMSLTNVAIETILFAITLPIMFKTKDLNQLLKPNNRNLILLVPFGAVLGPMLQIGQTYEISLPSLMIIHSVFYICLFGYSLLVELNSKINKLPPKI